MIALSLELLDAIRASEATGHVFVYFDHPEGEIRVWSGIGERTWLGETWSGIGGLGRVGGVEYTGELREHEVTIELSRVDMTLLGLASTGIQGRTVTVFLRWEKLDGRFFDDYLTMWKGLADYAVSSEAQRSGSVQTATLQIICRSPLADWRNAAGVAYTNEEQQVLYPGDTGFDRIPDLVNKEFEGWAAS